MLILSGLGPLALVKAGADALDACDPSPVTAISWFEESPSGFRLEAYAETAEDAEAARAIVAAAAPSLHLNTAPVEDADWVAMALDGLPPVRAGRFFVAGAHAMARAPRGLKRIWIEASEAFGTGHHGTTKGCLLALEGELRRRRVRRVLDVGAGSGVLAMAAAACGAHALAVEIDPRAAQIMGENVCNNRLEGRVRVRCGDGAKHARAKPGAYDLVFANILMRPLIAMAPAVSGAVAPGGTLILSGLLKTQEPLIRLAYASRGLSLVRRIRLEAWSTLVWRKG